MKKSIFYFLFSLSCFLALPLTLHAIGSGGGGAVTCGQDTWLCTTWSDCSSSGQQKRTCSLSFDCPNIETPARPAETQTCTPPCADDEWSCDEWSACTKGIQKRVCRITNDCTNAKTESPATERSCGNELSGTNNLNEPTKPAPRPSPACRNDVWECGEWSDNCDVQGNHQRICRRTLDCPNADTPQPPSTKRCEKLQCEDAKDMRSRIICRLKLTEAALDREEELKYLPEECRFYTGQNQSACIERYRSFKPCWNSPVGPERNTCAKNILKLRAPVAQVMSDCIKKSGTQAAICKTELREQVFEMIKFRIYDLEERAEELSEKGVSEETIADFVRLIITKKHEFSLSKTQEERKTILLAIRAEWKKFIQQAKKEMK